MPTSIERRGLRPPAGVNSRPRQLILPLASELAGCRFASHAGSPPVAAALVRANYAEQGVMRRAA